jgi:release factor glutamine methyltransferase
MTPAPRQAEQVWTTRTLLAWMKGAFIKAGIDSPQLCAEMLVAHVLGCERLKLYTDPDRPAAPLERQSLRDLTTRALKDEPVQYLIGEGWFFSLPFSVDSRVLIPRPATGTIVEHVLQHARATPGFSGEPGGGVVIVDVCTGSGCVATALAKHMPGAHVVATDISPDALEVAAKNTQRHGVADRVDLLEGNLLEPLATHAVAKGKGTLHYLVANPPYIPDDEWDSTDPEVGVQANVKGYEPTIALRGGFDGLDLIRPLLAEGPEYLRPGGLIMIEVAASRAEEAKALAEANGELEAVQVLKDFEGLARTIVARKKS